ncbi:hypothetical protein Purlil1_6463 [Purpureocillium lilacinum]|uniref:Uncharacterized protein n=1 Tax=Purpureocillium lilacinum TaxID=33203 RepID=A0ABR0BYH7_PURLI|nr:hypothetical protein Purlil1_6463 [Purpureocillium lilacinum]
MVSCVVHRASLPGGRGGAQRAPGGPCGACAGVGAGSPRVYLRDANRGAGRSLGLPALAVDHEFMIRAPGRQDFRTTMSQDAGACWTLADMSCTNIANVISLRPNSSSLISVFDVSSAGGLSFTVLYTALGQISATATSPVLEAERTACARGGHHLLQGRTPNHTANTDCSSVKLERANFTPSHARRELCPQTWILPRCDHTQAKCASALLPARRRRRHGGPTFQWRRAASATPRVLRPFFPPPWALGDLAFLESLDPLFSNSHVAYVGAVVTSGAIRNGSRVVLSSAPPVAYLPLPARALERGQPGHGFPTLQGVPLGFSFPRLQDGAYERSHAARLPVGASSSTVDCPAILAALSAAASNEEVAGPRPMQHQDDGRGDWKKEAFFPSLRLTPTHPAGSLAALSSSSVLHSRHLPPSPSQAATSTRVRHPAQSAFPIPPTHDEGNEQTNSGPSTESRKARSSVVPRHPSPIAIQSTPPLACLALAQPIDLGVQPGTPYPNIPSIQVPPLPQPTMRVFSRSRRRDAAPGSSTSKSAAVRQSMQQSQAQALLSYYSPAGMLVGPSPPASTSSSSSKSKKKDSSKGSEAASDRYNNMFIQHRTLAEGTRSSLASEGSRAPSYEASCRSGTSTPAPATARGSAGLTIPTRADADPLSVRVALVGLLAASTRAALTLAALNTQPLSATRALEVPARELKYFRLTTQLLHKHLRRAELRRLDRPARAALVDVDLVVALLTAAAMTVSELDARLADLEREARGDGDSNSAPLLVDVCRRHARALAKDANRIVMLDFVMTKLLSVLQVDSEAEALRHRSQAKESVGDMLQSDIALAARMAHLQDAFGAKATVPPARLEEIASRPPPAYSVPSPDSHDELPDYDQATSPDGRDGSVTIQAQAWSPFSGLTLDDLPSVRLIPVPLMHTELRAGEFYQAAYVDQVDEALEQLAEASARNKAKSLTQVLGFA